MSALDFEDAGLMKDDAHAHDSVCDRCAQNLTVWGGSHYHCASCDSTETTGSYGHHHGAHQRNGKFVVVEFHAYCQDGACAAADAGSAS